MKKILLIIFTFLGAGNFIIANDINNEVNCLNKNDLIQTSLNYQKEFLENQKFIDEFLKSKRILNEQKYIIPVVFHVFGTDFAGTTVTESTIINSLEHTNNDFNGLNKDFLTSDPNFEGVRGEMDIQFKLPKLDPDGNPTNGVIFYEEENMGLSKDNNEVNNFISSIAWDNFSYMNVYITLELNGDGVENLSGFAYYPNNGMSNQGVARVVYNGRYLLGNTNDKFASVLSHEFGHWLNLLHTFEGGCSYPNDYVEDTPPVDASMMGCVADNCENSPINGENFMDYNWSCYAMFTLGQIERMKAALQLPSRKSLWQENNLIKVGLEEGGNVKNSKNAISIFPNPTDTGEINISSNLNNFIVNEIIILDSNGRIVMNLKNNNNLKNIDLKNLTDGFYLLQINCNQGLYTKKLIINKK